MPTTGANLLTRIQDCRKYVQPENGRYHVDHYVLELHQRSTGHWFGDRIIHYIFTIFFLYF